MNATLKAHVVIAPDTEGRSAHWEAQKADQYR